MKKTMLIIGLTTTIVNYPMLKRAHSYSSSKLSKKSLAKNYIPSPSYTPTHVAKQEKTTEEITSQLQTKVNKEAKSNDLKKLFA